MTLNEGSIIVASESSLKSIDTKERKRKIKRLRNIYAFVIFFIVAISISTLAFKIEVQEHYKAWFTFVELIVFVVLIVDYGLRWFTAPARFISKTKSLLLFPFTMISIMLIISMLPSLYIIGNYLSDGPTKNFFVGLQTFKFMRILRIVMLANLFPPLAIFKRVISKNKWILYNVFFIVIITIVVFALVMYNVEQTADDAQITSFKDALYFSTITLTTIGFGDIAPKSDVGKAIVMIMSIIGIGILAIPSGVIAGGFLSEAEVMRNEKAQMEDKRKKSKLTKLKVTKKADRG
ncbi:ion transporter [Mycoplasma todarodis]|uniref:ion transporter n=1 Tax=Mycoplasma todarodis TaxID=1937191 RepID=UPI003B2D8DBD